MLKPYYETDSGRLWHGDALQGLSNINSADFGFADPPYGINKAEWDTEYPQGFEKELLRICRKGIAVTPGQKNIGTCINAMGENYHGVVSARNLNGMTFSNMGFENWIPTVLGGKVKRGQNYFEFSVRGRKADHPSPKPISYMIQLLLKFTDENDLIVDPFLGSGTTAIACEELKRKWIGIEIEEKYCEIAAKRIENERKQRKLF